MDSAFQIQLEQWGPDSTIRPAPTTAEAREYCRTLARSHYENFPVVSWLLPRKLHQHFYNIYAYCRWADDLADEVGDAARSLELLEWWRTQLDDCFDGRGIHPVFVALRETVQEFAIPREPFTDLLSAFEQDQRVTEYETFDELRDYCRRSADPVGRLVLYLCRAHNERNVAWSDSICTGLQLANFWQDVARDSDRGRIYLPREDRMRFGYRDDLLHSRATTPAFLELMRFQVERARRSLRAGLPLAAVLPFRLGVDIDLFARGGLAILDEIERIEYRVWDTRPTVSKWRFARLFAGSVLSAVTRPIRPAHTSAAEPLPGGPEAVSGAPNRSTGAAGP
ncbi:MAG: squalene synthase HpnC [Planctomycetaceae bacterium]